jgi:hypothetical protein
LKRLPVPFQNSGLSIIQRLRRSLQQRVCSGFAPDSLFRVSPERERTPPKTCGKDMDNNLDHGKELQIYQEHTPGLPF